MSIEDIQSNTVREATASEVDKIRYPDILFTIGYLNDPIEFNANQEFDPRTIVQQLDAIPNQVNRDFADFLTVDFNNSTVQYYSISMFSTIWDQTKYQNVISSDRRAFTQLV